MHVIPSGQQHSTSSSKLRGGIDGQALQCADSDLPLPMPVSRAASLDTWGACLEALDQAWGLSDELRFSDLDDDVFACLKDLPTPGRSPLKSSNLNKAAGLGLMSPAALPSNLNAPIWAPKAPSPVGEIIGESENVYANVSNSPAKPLMLPPLDTSFTFTCGKGSGGGGSHSRNSREKSSKQPAAATYASTSPFGDAAASPNCANDDSDSESEWEEERSSPKTPGSQKRGRSRRKADGQDVKRLKKNAREQRRANKINAHIERLRLLLEEAGVETQPTKSSILSEAITLLRAKLSDPAGSPNGGASRPFNQEDRGDDPCVVLFEKSSTPLAIARADHLGHFVACNNRFAKVFGCQASELRVGNPYTYTQQMDLTNNHTALSMIKAGEATGPREVVLTNPTGRRFLMQVTSLKGRGQDSRFLIFEPKARFMDPVMEEGGSDDDTEDASTPRAQAMPKPGAPMEVAMI